MAGRMKIAYIWARRRLRHALLAFGIQNHSFVNFLRSQEKRLGLSRFASEERSGVIRYYDGLQLRYRSQDMGVADYIRRSGAYEHETTKAVRSLLGPGRVFVDGGAHIGYYSVLAAADVGPKGHVYSFEPVPGTNAVLRENVELNGFGLSVTVESFAITDHRKTLEFIVDTDSSVSSRITSSSETGVPIEGISLDEYFADREWPTIDLVKIDIEGAELAGLRGMRELVRRNPAIAVIFEVHFQVLSRQDISMSLLFDELLQMGFTRFSILRPDGAERVGFFCKGVAELRLPDDLSSLAELPGDTVFNVLAQRSL